MKLAILKLQTTSLNKDQLTKIKGGTGNGTTVKTKFNEANDGVQNEVVF